MKEKKDLHILMLEDDPLDADLNRAQLNLLDEYNCIVKLVSDRDSYLEALKSQPDIILSDYSLPQYNGLEALNDLKNRKLLIPFIFVTGTINEETAADTIKSGAWDYVVKDRLFRLPLAIRSVLKLKEEKINTLKAEILNRKLFKAVEQSLVNVIIINIHGEIEYVNPRFTEVTGYTANEVIGKDLRILTPGNYYDENISVLWDSFKEGKSWSGETRCQKKNGTYYWESTSISPLKDENGIITHFVAVKEDITQRKNMEQEIISARDRAERSDKLKEVFLQNLSHEIRTPLNAIVGFAGLLNDPCLDPEQQMDFKTIIINSSNQLLSIVSDVLTVSRIQTGQEEIILKPTKINELIDNLKVIFTPQAERKKLTLIAKKQSDDALFTVLTDETKLIQILTNLLNNAVKFTHQGSIELGYEIADETIKFYVKDTGIGIPPEYHELIFERFRQADITISTNYGGTGLGLSISKSFAEMLDGSISVVSSPGKGSTFTLSIPFKKEKITPRISHRNNVIVSEKTFTILIAEDEEFNYQLIVAYLAGKKYNLIRAKNGFEAIDLCKKHPEIALVLMDIKMPEMDGQDALATIRNFRPDLPAIAQTAYALEHEKQLFIEKGFDDYIAKPIKKEDILEKIQNILMHHETI